MRGVAMEDAVTRIEAKLQAFYDGLPTDEQEVMGALLEAAAGPETQGFIASVPRDGPPETKVKRVLKVANFVVDVHYPNPDYRPPVTWG
jgi:hypothetical protein